VVPDRTPVVRIDQPGRDLRLANGTSTVVLDIGATDDFGLRTLRLLYTRVSGSGETFDFVDGEAPVRVTRASPTAWQGRATLDVRALGLAPGDTLVYHAAAQDGRTGADGLGESERYLVEIPREGALGGGDFSLPDSELRYALSQRMIIQLTERLLARQSTLDVETLRTEAQGLAVQQRRVRAEFVFLMGGEVVDEVEEAEHSHEVEAGRLDNSGQNELLDAVRQMSLAEQRLTDADLEGALVFEHRALSALQAAFGKRRYFMRTLPVRVAIDPDRRLSGDLERTTPAAWARAPLSPSAAAEARATLADVRALTPVSDGGAVAEVIAKLLALDTATRAWMPLAQQLASAFEPTAAPDMRQAAINAVASALNTRLVGAVPARMPVLLPRGREETGVATPGHSPP